MLSKISKAIIIIIIILYFLFKSDEKQFIMRYVTNVFFPYFKKRLCRNLLVRILFNLDEECLRDIV